MEFSSHYVYTAKTKFTLYESYGGGLYIGPDVSAYIFFYRTLARKKSDSHAFSVRRRMAAIIGSQDKNLFIARLRVVEVNRRKSFNNGRSSSDDEDHKCCFGVDKSRLVETSV